MSDLSSEQLRQEKKYDLPYHYIPVWNGRQFSQTRTLRWGYEYISYINFMLDKIVDLDFGSMLDVGCGDGRFLYEMHRRFPSKHLVGIDYSERAIGFARLMSPHVDYVCGDITDTNALKTKFDIITLIETLEHIPPGRIYEVMERLDCYLEQEGYLLLTVPSKNVKLNKKHYQHFDLRSLRSALDPFFSAERHYFINKKSALVKNILEKLMVNKYFSLNEKRLLRLEYRIYQKYFLHAEEWNAKRIFLVCKKKGSTKQVQS